MIPTLSMTTLSPPFFVSHVATTPIVLDPSLLAGNGAIVMTDKKDDEKKSPKQRRTAIIRFLLLLSFLPYLLPYEERPGIYKTERHSDVSRKNRKYLKGHLDTLPWEDHQVLWDE